MEIPELIRRLSPDFTVYNFTQQAGEIVHVPSGCLHAVRNLGLTIALTHNFVPKARHQQFLRAYRRSEHLSQADMAECERRINSHLGMEGF